MDYTLESGISTFTKALKQIEDRIASLSLSPLDAVADLDKAIRESCKICAAFVAADSDAMKASKHAFREAIAPWFSQSWYMDRALQKPRGYPGDYETLEGIYDQQVKSRGIGEALDLYFLQAALARAVQGRKDLIRDFLPGFLSSRHGIPRVLDIACGPCREIREVASRNGDMPFVFCGLDFDDAALAFAKGAITDAGFPAGNLSMVKQNVLRLTSGARNLKTYGTFDLIYSVGLYDYLPDDVLIRVLDGSSEMLSPDGQYLVAFKDSNRYDCTEYQWHVDWYFYQRTEADCRRLLEQSRLRIISMEREPSGIVMLFNTTTK